MLIEIANYRKHIPAAFEEPEDQEVRCEVLQARIAWLEEVVENQWKHINTLRKLTEGKNEK